MREKVIIYDVESYVNKFFLSTIEAVDGVKVADSYKTFFINDHKALKSYMSETKDTHLWTGYNNTNYDDLMLIKFLDGGNTDEEMRALSDAIIVGYEKKRPLPDKRYWLDDKYQVRMGFQKRLDNFIPNLVCDLNQLTGKGSLKMKSIVLGADSIMESPVDFMDEVTDETLADVVAYCEMDLNQTLKLYNHVEADLQVRDTFYELGFKSVAYSVNSPKLADLYFKANTKSIDSKKRTYFGKSVPLQALNMNREIEFETPEMIEWFKMFNEDSIKFPQAWEQGESFKFVKHDTALRTILMDAPNHYFTFGGGGLHSSGSNAFHHCAEDEYMREIDMTSMYPTSIFEYGICPNHIAQFSEVVGDLTAKRNVFKAKASEPDSDPINAIKSNALKLINNSIFGKLQDKYSYVYDMVTMFRVTMTNQILLLKLIDKLLASGVAYELVQANTDAVVLKYKKSVNDEVMSIVDDWTKLSRHTYGITEYKSFYQQSCNNYFAETTNGKVKAKGSFVLTPNLNQKIPISKIVKLATMDYLTKGVLPETTIRNSTDVQDFIFTANSTDFKVGESRLGYKAIRVVYSESGDVFKALKNDSIYGGMKEYIVAEQEPLKFLIKLSDHSVESLDLNYDKYIYEAYKMVYSILKPRNDNDGVYFLPKRDKGVIEWWHLKNALLTLNKGNLVAQWYEYLVSLGFSVIPKSVCKANYKGVRTGDKSTWSRVDARNALGLGIVMDNAISIDIDNPSKLDPEMKRLLLKYPTLRVHHGEDRVLNGGKGAFIFKTSGNEKIKASSTMVENLGFEILIGGNKVQTVMGIHSKNEHYIINDSDKLCELPLEILEYLKNCKTPEGKRAVGRITGARNKTVVVDRALEVDVVLITSLLEDNGIHIKNSKSDGASVQFWDTESHWFVVSRNQMDGKYYVNSNHGNFLPELKSIIER